MNELVSDKHKPLVGQIVSILVVILWASADFTELGPAWVLWTTRIMMITTLVSNVLGLTVTKPKTPAR